MASNTPKIIATSFFAPSFADVKAYKTGSPRLDEDRTPDCSIVPSRMRRATSLLTKMLVASSAQTLHSVFGDEHLQEESTDVAIVFGSAHGEIQIAVDQMAMMHDGHGQISPARFKNSVHNTAAGLISIVTKNRSASTAIAAGDDTFAMCLLEGILLLNQYPYVMVAVGEENLPTPLSQTYAVEAAAAAILIARDETPDPAIAHISLPVMSEEHQPLSDELSGVRGAAELLMALEAQQLAPASTEKSVKIAPTWNVSLRH